MSSIKIKTEADRKYHPAIAQDDLESVLVNLRLARRHNIPVTYEFKKRMEHLIGNINIELYAIKIEEPPPVLNFTI